MGDYSHLPRPINGEIETSEKVGEGKVELCPSKAIEKGTLARIPRKLLRRCDRHPIDCNTVATLT